MELYDSKYHMAVLKYDNYVTTKLIGEKYVNFSKITKFRTT